MRLRTSPKRAASPSTDAGLGELSATFAFASLAYFFALSFWGFGFSGSASTVPPAFSMASRAPLVAPMPFRVKAFLISPDSTTFAAIGKCRDDVGVLQGVDVDGGAFDLEQLVQAHFGA